MNFEWDAAKNARVPERKEPISLRVDQDVLTWFREGGPGYQSRMNAVLRSYMTSMESQKKTKRPSPGKKSRTRPR
jgi:uncharacterized protein (DUF4415 family)